MSDRDNVIYITDKFAHTNKSQILNPELTWLQFLLQSQNILLTDTVSAEQILREIEGIFLHCSDVSADGNGTPEIFDTDQDASSNLTHNLEMQSAREQLAIQAVCMTRSSTMPRVDATSTLPLKRLSFHVDPFKHEQKSKVASKLSSNELAVTTAVTIPFSEGDLRSNCTRIVGRMILQKFDKFWHLFLCCFFV